MEFKILPSLLLLLAVARCENANGQKKRGIYGEQFGLGGGDVGALEGSSPGLTQAVFHGNGLESPFSGRYAGNLDTFPGGAFQGDLPSGGSGYYPTRGFLSGGINSGPIYPGVIPAGLPSGFLPSVAPGFIPSGGFFQDPSSLPTVGVGAPVPLGRHVTVTNRVAVPVVVPQPYPVPVQNNVAVPVPQPVAVPVERPVAVPVSQPYPVPVVKHVGVPVEKHIPYPVAQPVPVAVYQAVPVPVARPVPVPVVRDELVPVEVPRPEEERNAW